MNLKFLFAIFILSITTTSSIFSDKLMISDFNFADKINDLDGIYDSWTKDPADPTMGCSITFSDKHRQGEKGYSLRVDYDVDSPNEAFCGVWMRLEGIDLANYKTLEFDIKGDAELGFTHQLNLEIKGPKQVSKVVISGIKSEWKHIVLPFNRFKGITDWTKMQELVFVFVDKTCDIKKGRLNVENMYFNTETYSPTNLMVADFQVPSTSTNLGGEFNAWTRDPNSETEYCRFDFIYDEVDKKNIVLQIDYRVESPNDSYNGMWFKLSSSDLRNYKKLSFRLKGDTEIGYPDQFKIELKTRIDPLSNKKKPIKVSDTMEVDKTNVPVTKSWKTVEIPLKQFQAIRNWESAQEFVIVFDKSFLTTWKGRIYIDDIMFSKLDPKKGPSNSEKASSFLNKCPHCNRQIALRGSHKRSWPDFCPFCGQDL